MAAAERVLNALDGEERTAFVLHEVEELSQTVLEGIDPAKVGDILALLGTARENLKRGIERNGSDDAVKR